MSEIILHHYPQSPVAEKVRVGLGIKGVSWRSVEIPRIPPKPELMPLTGGYRRTPVMQIGADIYCDSQAILRELERRVPAPTFFPGGAAGLAWGVSRWTDGGFFESAISLVLSTTENLPPEFAADRGRLYFGPDWSLDSMRENHGHVLSQLRAQCGWLDDRLAGGRPYMLGPDPGLPDALAYYLIWFIRGRWTGGRDFLAQFPNLVAWEERVKAIGHGSETPLSASDALDIAQDSTPAGEQDIDSADPLELSAGAIVGVRPDGDGGDPVVEGALCHLSRESVGLFRNDDRVGKVAIYFPRVGYRINTR